MSKILVTITLFLSLCLGCSLETEPSGISSFWNNEEDAKLGIDAAYAPFYEEEGFGRGHLWAGPASDDMVVNRQTTEIINLTSFINSSTNTGDGFYENWQIIYKIIRRANDVLRNVPAIDMNVSLQNRILGEANFLCGYCYFFQAKRYGGVPFYNYSTPNDINKARETKQVTYENIEKYLLKSIDYFEKEQLWHHSDDEWGRPNLGAALGLLAKVYLYWGKYDKAKEMSQKVIDSGEYELCESYKMLFSLEGEKSDEVLFNLNNKNVRHQGTVTSIVMLSAKLTGGIGWYYFAPTKSLYDAFEDGDERRNVTLKGVGDEVNFLGVKTKLTSDNISDMTTGYMCTKYSSAYDKAKEWNWESGADIPLLRYADVLLINAEAKMRLAGASPENMNQPCQEATESLNQVRLRAFNWDKEKYISSPSFKDLIDERRRELAFEDERHYDLVRWRLAKEVYSKATLESDPRGARNFNELMPCFALPQTEIDNSNGVLINNVPEISPYTMFDFEMESLKD
ncbi:MAG: RagB/SusD family nutrient uptake outer membrane protein [Bacteroidales bacterium]|nr:RagB/SusD family nutrient uptake outer membrane protein [Bacteroidales bacterium]